MIRITTIIIIIIIIILTITTIIIITCYDCWERRDRPLTHALRALARRPDSFYPKIVANRKGPLAS